MKFTSIKSEGGLIPLDILDKISASDIFGQNEKDFGIEKGNLIDEISKCWKAARTFYSAFQLRLNRLKPGDSTVRDTREQWIIPLLETLGFPKVTYFAKADEIDSKTYAISHRADDNRESLPIHIVGLHDSLDKRADSGCPRLSPHSLMQEFLNHTEHLWGIVTNGYLLRILRDSSRISRPIYVEFDLQQIFEQEKFNEFVIFYRLVHFSRFPNNQIDTESCIIEKYYKEAVVSGGRVRDKLRDGVEKALIILGNGFLHHPDNIWLRESVQKSEIKGIEYYRQLLRLIYRMLFLMVSEERNLVGPNDPDQQPIYYNFYSINRLREISHSYIPGISKHFDLWDGLLTTFALYSDERFGDKLSISPLNGDLFGQHAITDLEKCKLYNKDLLSAIKYISLYDDNGTKRKINYLGLDVEELGSVYESLLDFHPVLHIESNDNINFQLVFGSERKTTGSYYTNHDLVHELIQSALVPLINKIKEKKIPNADKIKEILQIKICDPAAGSGHFLLSAARRIAVEIATLKSGGDYPSPTEFRTALRDVIQRCIYGVDTNPLAVDLCKLALWLEGHTKGKPLSFLDHRIKCGNSLIGAFSFEQIKKGIPDEAFTAVIGDDKEIAKYFKKKNNLERKGQFSLFSPSSSNVQTSISESFSQFDEISINTTEDYHIAEDKFRTLVDSPKWLRECNLANIWTYAFFVALKDINENTIPTQKHLLEYLLDSNTQKAQLVGIAAESSKKNKFFHWFLEFPEVFAKGGFDCVLGNPPWEKIKLQEKEFFASRSLEIAKAPTAAIRKRIIEELKANNPVLFNEFEFAKRLSECESKFIRHSGRYPLTAKGDINTYSIFAELSRSIINDFGRVGIIVPTGIATDDTTKEFFADIVENESLCSIYDFENKLGLFPTVHRSYKFSLLTLSGSKIRNINADFAFFLLNTDNIKVEEKHFALTKNELKLLNPNTKNCPIFRNKKDAELTKRIYKKFPVLVCENEKESNIWNVVFLRMFDMTNDSNLFKSANELKSEGYNFIKNTYISGDKTFLPLYEGKMIWNYNHRASSVDYNDGLVQGRHDTIETSISQLANPNFYATPRLWVSVEHIKDRIDYHNYFLGFRDVTNSSSG